MTESMTLEQPASSSTQTETQAGLYLTFALEKELYGLQILAVQEIIQLVAITAVPRTPDFVRGVINLRGKVIPVVDLRRKFAMDTVEDTEQSCIIVVQVATNGSALTMGVVVDQVAEVLDVAADQIEPPPAFGAAVDTGFILGMGKVGDSVIMLLDIRRVLAGGELAAVQQMARDENVQ